MTEFMVALAIKAAFSLIFLACMYFGGGQMHRMLDRREYWSERQSAMRWALGLLLFSLAILIRLIHPPSADLWWGSVVGILGVVALLAGIVVDSRDPRYRYFQRKSD